LDVGSHGLLGGAASARRRRGGAGGAGEVVKVCAFGVVELEGGASASRTPSETPLISPRSGRL
jgi:hypothetical protein